MSAISSPARPGGLHTQVQVNDTGHFAGDPAFVWDKATGSVAFGPRPSGASSSARVRLSNRDAVSARNVAGTQDILGLQIYSDDRVYVGGFANDAGLYLRSAAEILLNRGIRFPTPAVASSDVNTLDDYKEGTFVPYLWGSGGASGQTYSNQYGQYIKLGRLVFAQIVLTTSALGTINGTVQLSGLPFAVAALHATAVIPFWSGLTTAASAVQITFPPGGGLGDLYYTAGVGGSSSLLSLTQAQLAGLDVRFSIKYMAPS
jgi:hypothetical protein